MPLHKLAERRTSPLIVQGLELAKLNNCILEIYDNPEVNVDGLNVTVTFKRKSGDQMLDLAIRTIHRAGGRIISVEIRTGKLLDVLERLETETEKEGAMS